MKMRWGLLLTAFAVLTSTLLVGSAHADSPSVKPVCLPKGHERTIIKTSADSSSVRITRTNLANDADVAKLAAIGERVGYNTDDSPEWTNPADGRTYWYVAEAWMNYIPSSPCGGDDSYEATANLECWRHAPGDGNALSPCYFRDEELALHRGTLDNAIWANPWGYHKYVRGDTADCILAANTPHLIPDNRLARSKVAIYLSFRDPFHPGEILHTAFLRSLQSHAVWQGSFAFNGGGLQNISSMPAPSAGPDLC